MGAKLMAEAGFTDSRREAGAGLRAFMMSLTERPDPREDGVARPDGNSVTRVSRAAEHLREAAAAQRPPVALPQRAE